MFPIIDKTETGIHLRKIMDEKNLSVKDVQTFLGLGSVQSVYHWLNGISMPTIDNLYALSELFEMAIDDMVRGNRKPKVDNQNNICVLDFEPIDESRTEERLRVYFEKMKELHAA